ncbi:MAG: Crp/Fnr family transcriptional regulator [Caldilinea sp.]
MYNQHLLLVRQNPIFHGLSAQLHEHILQHAHVLKVEPNGFLIRQGDPATAFYILAQGHIRLIQLTPDGSQVLLRFLNAGQEFGVIAVLSGLEYPISAQAIEHCEVLVWEGELLAQLMEQHPRIGFNALRAMAVQNQELQRRYQEMLTERVEQRLAQALVRLVRQLGQATTEGTLLDCPISREDLAEMIGTTLFTVSRILSQWEHEGVVEAKWKKVLILRQQDLERLADPAE